MAAQSRAILIAGPTASGKSALALSKAQDTGGYIINTDSMQVYGVLDRLTARPSPVDLGSAEHHLYGHVHPCTNYSAGHWLADVGALMARPELSGRTAIFVGGTGLYFRALTGGVSDMPDVPPAIREAWRARLIEEGPEALHPLLAEHDAEAAARIKPQDGQRIVRALEIFEASGKPITYWQNKRKPSLVDPNRTERYLLLPERTELAGRIDQRLRRMVEQGALDEVRAMMALGLDPALPAMKAIGVPEFAAHLRGETDIETALYLAGNATRQYAKRQYTWFRNQCGPEWQHL